MKEAEVYSMIDAIMDANKQFLQEAYEGLPDHMREGARLYVEHGIMPGGFMTAVLENDFVRAAVRADSINAGRMKSFAHFLQAAPRACWGSEAAVRRWHMQGGMDGVKAQTLERMFKAVQGEDNDERRREDRD